MLQNIATNSISASSCSKIYKIIASRRVQHTNCLTAFPPPGLGCVFYWTVGPTTNKQTNQQTKDKQPTTKTIVGHKLAPSWTKLVPSWFQVGPSWPQVGPKLAPSWPKLAPSWPFGELLGSSWPPDGPKSQQDHQKGPKGPPQRTPNGPPKLEPKSTKLWPKSIKNQFKI